MPEIQESFLALIGLLLLTIIIVVALVQGFASYRARSDLTREEAYRKLSEQAAAAEQKNVEEQKKIAATLEEMRNHLVAIEKILREVE